MSRLDGKKLMIFVFILFVLSGFLAPSYSQTSFVSWVSEFKEYARSNGISESVIASSLRNIRPLDKVLRKDENQAEFEITFNEYKNRFVTSEMITKGRELKKRYGTLLSRVADRYGVAPQFILAIWGIESRYGQYGSKYRVIPAMATLAYNNRRSGYFKKELLNLLKIIEREERLQRAHLKGSWAGAMGQPQFMPSSYINYAVDFDNDGTRDIWNTPADIFASIANYLSENGWEPGEVWGARVTPGAVRSTTDFGEVIRADGESGPAFITYENFDVLLRYNPANHYALTVGLLADEIAK